MSPLLGHVSPAADLDGLSATAESGSQPIALLNDFLGSDLGRGLLDLPARGRETSACLFR